MKKLLVFLPFFLLSCGPSDEGQNVVTSSAQAEDCDYEDMLEYDTDCGFPAGMKKSVKKATVKKTATKNVPVVKTPVVVTKAPLPTVKSTYTPPRNTYSAPSRPSSPTRSGKR